eukprot:Rmarinus@m.22967
MKVSLLGLALLFGAICATATENPPNFVLIIADDLGYNDIGAFGSVSIQTPTLDRMAYEGMKMTQFYTDGPLCTPSRGAMLTGRLPPRLGLYTRFSYPVDEFFRVFYPSAAGGMPQEEVTIADALKGAGYATGMIGKWHLGHREDIGAGPMDQGFDFFFGMPYSHEEGYPGPRPHSVIWPPVPLYLNRDIIEQPTVMEDLTERYTEHARSFIHEKASAGQPFFLHIAYEEPHVPLFVNEKFSGKSRGGMYGDCVYAMDHSIEGVLDALAEAGVAENTLVVFASDNGAWTEAGTGLPGDEGDPDTGGNNAPFKDGKGSTWEGGIRVPAIAYWPGTIPPASTLYEAVSMADLLPTFLDLAGASEHVPSDRVIDGQSFAAHIRNPHLDQAVHDFMFFWREHTLYAVRYGPYKAHFFTRTGFETVKEEAHDPPLLFNVEMDPGEHYPLPPEEHDHVLNAIREAADEHLATMEMYPSQYEAQDWSGVPCCDADFDLRKFKEYMDQDLWELALWTALGCVC